MMKEVVVGAAKNQINLDDIRHDTPIFVKRNCKLVGMVVKECHYDEGKWIIRIGGANGADGWHKTRQECMERGMQYHYTFHVEG